MTNDRIVTRTGVDNSADSEPITAIDIFRPSRQMKQVKALFYSKVTSGTDISKLTAEQINELAPHRSLSNWCANSEFMSWFKGSIDYRQRVDYLLARQLDNLEAIIENEAESFSAKEQLMAGKQLIELRTELGKETTQAPEITEETLRKATLEAMERVKARKEIKLAPAVKLPD